MSGLLSLIVWLPLIGGVLLLLVPEAQRSLVRGLAFVTGAATLGTSVFLATRFEGESYRFQFQELIEWLPQLGIHYRLGVDGISLWLVVLTSLISLVALVYGTVVATRTKLFFALVLLLETAMLGAFVSLDLILFYGFFELSLVPMYFLITIWGGEKRRQAGAKFFIYTFAGSIFMLVGMVVMAVQLHQLTGAWSFSILDMQSAAASGKLWLGALQLQSWVFWAFVIAFLIKAPAFPFHTWIADVYSESPIAGPILSSVMVKMGSYGLLRFCLPLFPGVVEEYVPILMGLAVAGILFGGVVAAVQPDMRRMLAYSSLSHMGFVLLGIFSLNQIGMVGGAYQQLNHAITASAMFLLVGFLIQRRGTSEIASYGGLKAQMPIFATLFLISMLASVGLPGLNGFVGELLAMMGAFNSGYHGLYGLSETFVVLAAFGVVLAAVYLFSLTQKVLYGPVTAADAKLRDLKLWEKGLACALVVLMFWGGLYPMTFLKPMEASVSATRKMATESVSKRPLWGEPMAPQAGQQLEARAR